MAKIKKKRIKKEIIKNNSDFKKKDEPLIVVTVPTKSFQLTEEQEEIVKLIVNRVDTEQVTVFAGLAGTGKTTVVSYLNSLLKNFAYCAFTGKAADVLNEKGINATTIHSLIYDVRQNEEGIPSFRLKSDTDFSGIVVDEASMVSKDLYDDLLQFNVPVIFVGDHGQLEPINDTFCIMKNPDFKLETVHRNAGDIAIFAHHLRNGNDPEDFASNQKVKIIHKNDGYKDILPKVDQIICGKNKTRVAINQFVRKEKGYGDLPTIGDKIVSLRNSKKYKIYNGTQAVIKDIKNDKLTILVGKRTFNIPYNVDTFNQEASPAFDPKPKFHPFDYSYAITAHKSQGSEWDSVVVLDECGELWDKARWKYTAASRAKKELYWIIR